MLQHCVIFCNRENTTYKFGCRREPGSIGQGRRNDGKSDNNDEMLHNCAVFVIRKETNTVEDENPGVWERGEERREGKLENKKINVEILANNNSYRYLPK